MSTVRSIAARQRADPLSKAVMTIVLIVMAAFILSVVTPPQAHADAPSQEEYFPMQPFFHDSCGITDDSYTLPAQPVEGSEQFTSEGGDEIWRSTHRSEFGDYIVTDMHREGVRKAIIAFVVTDPTKIIGAPREGIDTYVIDSSQDVDVAVWSYTYNSEPCPTEGPITQPSGEPTSQPTPTPTVTESATPPPADSPPSTAPAVTASATPSASPTLGATTVSKATPPVKGELAATGSKLNTDTLPVFVGVVVFALLLLVGVTIHARRKDSKHE